MLSLSRRNICGVLATATVAGAGLLAAPAVSHAEGTVDDEAVQLLRAAVEQLADAEQFQVTMTMNVEVTGRGMRQEQATTYELAVQRPNRLSLRTVDGMEDSFVVSDGETLTEYIANFNRYIEQPAPADVADIFLNELDETVMTTMQAFGMIGALFSPERMASYEDMLREATVDDAEALEGDDQPSRRLSLLLHMDGDELGAGAGMGMDMDEAFEMPVEIWISEGDQPTIRRMKPDMSKMHERMAEEMPHMAGLTIEMWHDFTDWQLDAAIDDERFAFVAPEGVQQADSLQAAIEAFTAERQGGPGPRELVGEAAPEFELALHGGGEMKLADHIGEDIVILDFWATWCGPCVQALPALTDVAEQFADDGVVLYAVNQQESDDQVTQFMADKPYELTVPMDRNGRVGQQYRVRGIPQTVVIGRDGTVQAVHVGFGPNTKQQLESELQTLVDGGSLVGE
ncbi:redoxin domain-containing protein [Phycisphaerales bacterium AB-hyl4]|uniref:Redoxin domain-containing protein n=1 Tax=Natronomicrosphaera hydrolytica TaxID=3242702 RepID=A0ABV4UCA4_9BACT